MTNPINYTTAFASPGSWTSVGYDTGQQPQPPQASLGWVSMPPDYYFELEHHQAYFRQMRKSTQQWNAQHRPGPSWTESDELSLVNKLSMEWFQEPWENLHGAWTDGERLNIDALPIVLLRKKQLPQFKINYQTYAEIKLRLYGTLIAIKGHPFYVSRIKEKNGTFWLQLVGPDDKTYVVDYKDVPDLRSIPAMYLVTKQTGWLARHPGRVYQQGLNRNNTSLWSVDGTQILTNPEPSRLVRDLAKRADKPWNETLADLMMLGEMHSVRLSDNIAVLRQSDDVHSLACYRGRTLGNIKEDTIMVEDEDDLHQEWISNATKAVGLNLAA